jgi:hypothetical protein
VPPITRSRSASANPIGILAAELLRPAPNHFVADLDPAGGEYLLDHRKAQRKTVIEPNRQTDHLSGEAMAGIQRMVGLLHAPSYGGSRSFPVNVMSWMAPSTSVRRAKMSKSKNRRGATHHA